MNMTIKKTFIAVLITLAVIFLPLTHDASAAAAANETKAESDERELDKQFSGSRKAKAMLVESMNSPEDIPELIKYINDKEYDISEAALKALAKLGEAARPAVPSITALLRTGKKYEPNYAMKALEELGPAASDAVPELLALVNDRERINAINKGMRSQKLTKSLFRALLSIGMPPLSVEQKSAFIQYLDLSDNDGGNDVKKIVKGWRVELEPQLTAILENGSSPPALLSGVLSVMGGQLTDAQKVTDACKRLADEKTGDVRLRALQALYATARDDKEVIARIADGVSDKNVAIARDCARKLRFMKPEPRTYDVLKQWLAANGGTKSDKTLREYVVCALGVFGAQALPDVEAALRTDDAVSQAGALQALALMKSDAAPALSLIKEKMTAKSSDVRKYAYSALAAVGTKEALALLGQSASSKDKKTRSLAADSLAKWGGDTADAVAMLTPMLKDAEQGVAFDALKSLSKLAPDKAVPVINEVMSGKSKNYARKAAELLFKMDAAVSVPLLENKLDDPDPMGRAMAAAAFTEVKDISAVKAAPKLIQLSESDPDATVRKAATGALSRLMRLQKLSVPNVALPSVPDLTDLPETDWHLAVVTARELVRAIMGDMSDEENAKLDAQWEPMFANPSMEMVDYLKKLNALLMRFVGLRAALSETGYSYQEQLTQAWTAAGFGEWQALDNALSAAEYCLNYMQGLQKELAKTGEAIIAMTPPPDPAEAAARARKRHADAIALAKGDKEIDEGVTKPGMYWVMVEKTSTSKKGYTQIGWWAETNAKKGGKRDASFSFGEGHCSGSENVLTNEGNKYSANGGVKWTTPPRVIKSRVIDFPFDVDASWSWSESVKKAPQAKSDGATVVIYNADEEDPWGNDKPSFSQFASPVGVEILDGSRTAMRSWSCGGSNANGKNTAKVSHRGEAGISSFHDFRYLAGSLKEGGRIEFYIHALSAGGSGETKYVYELMDLDEDDIQNLKDEEEKEKKAEQKAMEAQIEQQRAAVAESLAKIDAAAVRQENIKYFTTQVERARADLQKATDPESRRELEYRLLVADANLHGERDLMTYEQTGEFVRTRTAYDDYVTMRVEQKRREMAEAATLEQRRVRGLQKMIDNAPDELKTTLSDFVERNRDYSDPEKTRKIIGIVNERIQGHWGLDAAKHEEAAVAAEEAEFYAQMTKLAAGAVITAGAAPLAAGLGASAQVVRWAPLVARVAFGGTTGYIEGGAGEAVKQSLAWSSQAGYLGVEAYNGFTSVYDRSGGDVKASVKEAAWRSGQAFVMGKVFEYGVGLSSRALTKAMGPSAQKNVFASLQRPSVQQQFDAARYNEQMKNSRSIVKAWQDKQFEYNKLTASGVSSPQAANLRAEIEKLTASINSDFSAKWLLKHTAPCNVQKLFDSQVNRIYDRTMVDFRSDLAGKGYDMKRLEFRTFRNAASAGSVGMDQDIGLNEYGGKLDIYKNGKKVSYNEFMDDAQQSWNYAYNRNTGYSATQSDVHITTSKHAEAFADTRLLANDIDFRNISTKDLRQAGDVFREKARLSSEAMSMSEIGKTQRVCRDIEKELRTKVFKHFDYQIKNQALRGNKEAVQRLREARNHTEKVYECVKGIGKDTADPYEMYRLRNELKALTGTNNAEEVMNQMAEVFVNIR